MPYNNASIPPTEEITGQTLLPLARVKKILAVDEEIGAVSANATYAITIATELFIRHFAEQAFNVMKAEKKPRRQMQYVDLANAVSRVDNLSFLEDIVPKTTTVREYRHRKGRTIAQDKMAALPNGQTVLDGTARSLAQHPSAPAGQSTVLLEAMDVSSNTVAGSESHGHTSSQPQLTNGQQSLVLQHHGPGDGPQRDASGDVEMSQ